MKFIGIRRKYNILLVGIFVVYFMRCNFSEKALHPKRPNILFAISDDQSFMHTSFAGSKIVNTPAFDRIASEGVYFTNCIAGSPGCAPSRSSIVTGRHHWQNEQSGQHASSWMKKHVPFVDLLVHNGYATGMTGKGVEPFQYARYERDSLWRVENAAGRTYNNIRYEDNSSFDERPARGISNINYFANFKYFMEKVRNDKPFFFWYGGLEPHRVYEQDSWKGTNKDIRDAVVPEFLPDNEIIRGDLLDYAVEIDWFDLHLQRMLEYLEEIDELDNTIVVVTSDNGLSFPRAKANCYEYGIHVPLAIRYPKEFPGGRIVDDLIGFVDIAPTILEMTGTSSEGMLPITGESFLNILKSKKEGLIDNTKLFVYSGRERHSSSRYKNWGYPQRAIRSQDYLLIWNMIPDRWPAGDPQRVNPKYKNDLLPMYGIDENGVHHPDWAFTDIDAAPSKSVIVENWEDEDMRKYLDLAVAKRPKFELFDVKEDPFNLVNLAEKVEYSEIRNELQKALEDELKATGDPRIVGPDKEIFDIYNRYLGPIREFPEPN